jgi:hypothetical protein
MSTAHLIFGLVQAALVVQVLNLAAMVDGLQLFHQILVFLVYTYGPVVVVAVEVETLILQSHMVLRQMDWLVQQSLKYVAMVVVPVLTLLFPLLDIGV